MNFYYKNKLLVWVLIFLVVVNIAALGSFFLFSKSQESRSCCSPEEQQCNAFRNELNLSAGQEVKVTAINRRYKEAAEPVALAIKEVRAAILTELEKEQPDTMQLNAMTDRLTHLQVTIQKENIKQYSELKRVCTPEQAQMLSALYRDLYGCPAQDGRMQHRYRHGKGNDQGVRGE